MYFLIDTAVIFALLWLLQTVFLQGTYNRMLIRNTRAAAEEIAAGAFGTGDSAANDPDRDDSAANDPDRDDSAANSLDTDRIDAIALENSLLVYVTDRESVSAG